MDDGKKGKGGSSIFVLFDSFTLEVQLLSFALFSRTSSPPSRRCVWTACGVWLGVRHRHTPPGHSKNDRPTTHMYGPFQPQTQVAPYFHPSLLYKLA